MIAAYRYKEIDYEDWLKHNQQGFVFNYCHTPSLNKLHHANCSFLNRPKDSGVRTTYEKICSNSLLELEDKVVGLCNDAWSKCGHCFK
jgi:molybdate-binding protein